MLGATRPASRACSVRHTSSVLSLRPLPARGCCSLQRRRITCQAVETEPAPSPLDSIALKTIEDLDTNYCDDFECTSSPAVEQTVRSLARELQRGKYSTASLYQAGVTYSDGFRSFTGAEGFVRQRWIADSLEKPRMTILKLRMLDKSTSQVEWVAAGKLVGGPEVEISFTTTAEHNLLTGRITSLRETWNLKRCSPPAALLATINRYTWSARAALTDAREKIGKAAEKMGGGDGGAAGPNMSDPTRFYTQPDNNNNQDVIAVGFLIALLYLAFKLYGELENLG